MRARSRVSGATYLVLRELAETAHHDGVSWHPQGPPADPRSIAFGARCSEKSVERAVKTLVGMGELEVRRARRGRSWINVYRVVVGTVADLDVDYGRLPFQLDEPFSTHAELVSQGTRSTRQVVGLSDRVHPDNLSGSTEGVQPDNQGSVTPTSGPVQPDNWSEHTSTRTSKEPSAAARAGARDTPDAAAAGDRIENLEQRLVAHGVSGALLVSAIAEPDRALAWLDLAEREADLNVGGFFRAGFQAGGWPGPRFEAPTPVGPLERSEQRVRGLIANLGAGDGADEARHWIDREAPESLTTIERAELHALVDELVSDQLPAVDAAQSAPATSSGAAA